MFMIMTCIGWVILYCRQIMCTLLDCMVHLHKLALNQNHRADITTTYKPEFSIGRLGHVEITKWYIR